MRFLSVADRELRAAARHKMTHRARWLTASVFFGLLVWLIWVFDGFRNRQAAPQIFQVFSGVIFFYCITIGTARTADCLSSEKREGTLGLLFLTNLNSAEIIAGKLCSSALAAVYGLFAIFPMLAVLLLMGGVTFGHFGRTVLALVNTIFFSVAAGFVASAVCVRQFTAIALATALGLIFGAGLLAAAEALNALGAAKLWVDGLPICCPLYTLISAQGARRFVPYHYWFSLAAVAGMSWTWLGLATWRLARTWQDRPKKVRAWSRIRIWQRWRQRGSAGRAALRRRLLEINPFFWLDGRRRVSAPVFMLLTVLLVVMTVQVATPYWGRVVRAGTISPLVGHLFAWLWTGLAIHGLVLYYAAMAASRRLAEDKQTGALELILSTPTTERSISRGLWMAYGRRLLFPALVALLVHFFFIWQCVTLCVLDPPGKLPAHFTQWQLFWSALFDKPLNGFFLDWQFVLMFRILVLLLVLLIAVWITLGWVGRWLGLRLKHPGFAPMTALALVSVPPVALFSLVCYIAGELKLYRMSERQFLPMMMWVAFGIGAVHCVLLSAWAASHLRRDLRTIVTSRFQPPSLRRWWIPRRRTVVRFATGTAALAATLVAIILFFYGYQNWRGQRRWTAFQRELRQRGESLDLAAVVPGPVPDGQNFARSPAFQNLLNRRPASNAAAGLLQSVPDYSVVGTPGNSALTPWMQQGFADFDRPLAWIAPKFTPGAVKDRKKSAAAVLDGLNPLHEDLAAVALAAQQPFFRATTSRDAAAVYQSNSKELVAMQRLHFLFQLRASALLALNREPEAGEDVLTSLRLAQLSRQSPDVNGSLRAQVLLARSLQPVWEGLAEHRWNGPQLAAFQENLARFDLLSDHTNAVRRAVLANIEIWRAIPDARTARVSVPTSGGGYMYDPAWQMQPRAWWFDSCIQLYRAGQNTVARVDVAAGRVTDDFNWSDLNGLPLDNSSSQLFQQTIGWGANPTLVSFAQTAANQAVIACALERYRLAHGAFPETLEQLLPDWLGSIPRDISRGRPMFYHREDKDNYALRGAGQNGIIDQGKVPSDDWLWSFTAPTNAPPALGTKRK
jgi:ABC-type Na+ efflux pump permease subunit